MGIKNILGFDIGGTKTSIVFGNSKGEIKDKISFPTESSLGFHRSFENIAIGAKLFLQKNHKIKFDCISVSIGGPLDIKKGIIYSPPNLKTWKNIPLKKLLRKEFKLPVYIEHDGNAGALAEYYFGAGKGYKNIIFLTMGTGIGAGLIFDGRIYHGSNDMAGEIGHLKITDWGPIAYGKKGSFESFCSGSGISKLANLLYPKKYKKDIEAKEIFEDYSKNVREAKNVIMFSSKYLGEGLAVLVDILNPEIIIIGSLAVRYEKILLKSAIKIMRHDSLKQSGKICKVVPAKLKESIGDVASLMAAISAK